VKFFIDHNLSPQLIKPILAIHPRHTFLCALEEQLTKTDDVPLFSELVKRGFEAIITRDRNQLANDDERAALLASGLHWLGVKDTHVPGLLGIALDAAAVTIGLTVVLPELTAEQRAYRFPAIPHQKSQRAKPVSLLPRPPDQQLGAPVTPAT
jgi:hypothetical protein